jgi:hypothetical protein
MTSRPLLRPLSVGEILDAGIKIYTRHWKVLFAITATIIVPLHILTFGLTLVMVRQLDELQDFVVEDFDPTVLYTLIGVLLLSGLVSLLALLVVNAATLRAVADGYMGLTPDRATSLSLALKRVGTLVGNSILQVLAIGGVFVVPIVILAVAAAADGTGGAGLALLGLLGFLAAGLVAIWLGISWTVAVPTIMVEKTGATEALGRSLRLIRGRWWPVFGVVVLVAVIRWVIGAVVGAASSAIAFAEPDNLFLAAGVDTIQSMLTDIVLLPFAAAVVAVLYFDLRVRKEGFDLELLARSIGSEWSAGTRPGAPGWAPPPTGQPSSAHPPPTDETRWSAQPPPPPSGWEESQHEPPPPPTGAASPWTPEPPPSEDE